MGLSQCVSSDDTNEVAVRRRRSVSHLILGPRTGYADTEARARAEIAPARLHEAAEAGYEEFSNVTAPVPVSAAASLSLTQGREARRHRRHLATGAPQAGEAHLVDQEKSNAH